MNKQNWIITLLLLAIVDRVESDFAVLEWNNLALSGINKKLLPNISEGDQLIFWLSPNPKGSSRVISNNPLTIEIDGEPVLIPLTWKGDKKQRYILRFYKVNHL